MKDDWAMSGGAARAAGPVMADPRARDRAFARARRHSRRVRLLRILLPSLAVIVVAGFVGATQVSRTTDLSALGNIAIEDGKVVMSNPKLEGVNRDNLPYSMTAERAVQDGLTGGPVRLEGIDARLPFDRSNYAQVDSASAIYDRERNTLVFDAETTVTTTSGLTATLQSAQLDIEKGDLTTSDPVAISLEGTDIAADGMTVVENGKVLIFEKRVKVAIEPSRVRTPEKMNGAQDGG